MSTNDKELEQIAETIVAKLRGQMNHGPTKTHAESHEPHGCCGKCGSCGHCAKKRPTEVRSIVGQGASRISCAPGGGRIDAELARYIDHTLLKPDTTVEEIEKLCAEAREYSFASVCVNTCYVPLCAARLAGSGVKVCSVVGFPLGAMLSSAKAFETREAVRAGAEEIDMVINVGALKSRNYSMALDDISQVVQAARPAIVKVILETCLLSDEEKVAACTLSKLAGAKFVKTSTGFSKGGATAHDVSLMHNTVGDDLEVKASGGIRSENDARQMIAAGATRLGASASVAIVTGGAGKSAY